MTLTAPHATVFVDRDVAGEVEVIRRRWDSVMAGQIAAHVTVAYPRETPGLDEMCERVRTAAALVAPFRLAFGSPFYQGPPHGLGLAVSDVDGGWARLRAAVLAGAQDSSVRPHITLVHPRTSHSADAAWAEVRGTIILESWTVRGVAVTAFDGQRWVVVEESQLAVED